MTIQNEHERVEKLLNELAEIGAGSFKAEYRNDVSKWRKIGMAISHTGNYGPECYELANTVAEDWNWHNMVAIVDFFLGVQPWDHTINYLKSGVDGVYTVHCYDCKDRKVKLTLEVENIDQSDIAELKRREAIAWHLQNNFIPPQPAELLEYCIEAIDACNEGDPARVINPPGGVTLTAGELVDDLKLSDLLEA